MFFAILPINIRPIYRATSWRRSLRPFCCYHRQTIRRWRRSSNRRLGVRDRIRRPCRWLRRSSTRGTRSRTSSRARPIRSASSTRVLRFRQRRRRHITRIPKPPRHSLHRLHAATLHPPLLLRPSTHSLRLPSNITPQRRTPHKVPAHNAPQYSKCLAIMIWDPRSWIPISCHLIGDYADLLPRPFICGLVFLTCFGGV